MDATELLEQQHREVEKLFKAYESATRRDQKQKLFDEVADKLAAHSTIEEALFYPAVYVGDLEPLLQEAVEEHLAVKRIIADLLGMEPSDESFDAKMKVLKETVEHHVEEEEGELFPKVRRQLSKEAREDLADEMDEMFDDLVKGHPRTRVLNETAQAAQLR